MPFPTAHALLIGVGTYARHPTMNVPITADDARAVAAVLRDPRFCGYPESQVTLLTDALATRAGVLAAFDTLAQRVGADDTVFVFYAGHGEFGADGYYLTTHDTRMEQGAVVAGMGLREAEVIAKFRALQAKRVLLIVNACHAGNLSPVLAAGEPAPTGTPMPANIAAALLGTGSGRVILSACRENQYSFIGDGALTLFTQALVDGLQGKGIASTQGYISLFDLYTQLYFALEEAVATQVPAEIRTQYGDKQEPELTILKGVGPFPVALWRGATTLGAFNEQALPPDGTAVREVSPARAQAMLRQYQQQIGDHAQVGVAIAGDVQGDVTSVQGNETTIQGDVHGPALTGAFSGPVTVNAPDQSGQSGGNSAGSGNTFQGPTQIGDTHGPQVHGAITAARDVNIAEQQTIHNTETGGDSIRTGQVSGTGIAIGRGAQSHVRTVNTGGGDYAEGGIDKRRGTFVAGDQFNMSGNFSGALLNIKSTLSSVSQHIGAMPHGDAATKAELQSLIARLNTELQQTPAAQTADAEAVAETAKAAVEQAIKPQPNRTLVQISAEGLQQAAQNLAAALPNVMPIAQQIAEAVRRMV